MQAALRDMAGRVKSRDIGNDIDFRLDNELGHATNISGITELIKNK